MAMLAPLPSLAYLLIRWVGACCMAGRIKKLGFVVVCDYFYVVFVFAAQISVSPDYVFGI